MNTNVNPIDRNGDVQMLHQIHPHLHKSPAQQAQTSDLQNAEKTKTIAGKILQKEFEEGKFKFRNVKPEG